MKKQNKNKTPAFLNKNKRTSQRKRKGKIITEDTNKVYSKRVPRIRIKKETSVSHLFCMGNRRVLGRICHYLIKYSREEISE